MPVDQTRPEVPLARTRALVFGVIGVVAVVVTAWASPPPSMPVEAWRMAGVAIWMASWWIGETIPLGATALVPLVAFPLLGILPSGTVAREYGNHLVYLFFGGFALAIAIERWNLHLRIALAVLSRFGARPRRLLSGFAVSVALLSMWISNTAAALMTLPVVMAVVGRLADHATIDGIRDAATRRMAERTLGPVFMLTVAYAASCGGMATLVGTPPNIVLAGALHELVSGGPTLSFARWMVLGVPVAASLLALVLFIVPRTATRIPLGRVECGTSIVELLQQQRRELGPLRGGERVVLVVFAATVVAWITRAPLELGSVRIPGWAELLPDPSAVHDATVAVAAALLLFCLRAPAPGAPHASIPLLDWKSVREKVPWEVLLLFGGGFALARGFEETGLSERLASQLAGLAGAPVPFLVLGVCLMTTFLTEVTSNTATATVLMPVLAAVAEAIGVEPAVLMVPGALAASCAFMLPVATPPNAVVFGSGWVTVDEMARTGLVLNLASAIVLTLLCWWLVPFVA